MARTTARPARRVVDALVERADIEPAELTPTLSTAVDPDALNALVERADSTDEVAIRFEYEGDEVLVRGDGRVAVQ